MKRPIVTLFVLFGLLSFLAGCSGKDGKDGKDGSDGVAKLVTVDDVVRSNANMAYAAYSDALLTALELQKSVSRLISTPNDAHFLAAKKAWLAAREPYGQSEVFRFRGGPIESIKRDGTMGVEGDGPEPRINAWPLGEALIDYVAPDVDGDAGATINIIADAEKYPEISPEVLIKNFELNGDEANVTTGYHAIEFLLWGQDLNRDLSSSTKRDTSAGQRPVTDYDKAHCTSGSQPSPALICERRGQYLQAAVDLLVADLALVAKAWNPSDGNNHYAKFVKGGEQSLAKIVEGMGRLSYGELAGERMNISLLKDSQEDEHSCFSDNTHRDIYLDAKGIQNAFTGQYVRVDGSILEGVGLDDLLIATGHIELENKLRAALEESMIKIIVIDQDAKAGVPYDNQIQDPVHRKRISAAIEALSSQASVIDEVVKTLKLSVGDLRQDTEQNL